MRARQSQQVSKTLLRAMTVAFEVIAVAFQVATDLQPALLSSKVQRQRLSGCAFYW
jgi:hypothetical protein